MILETGFGVENADSYASISDTTTFHSTRGNTGWSTATVAAQTSALVRATDYIEAFYAADGDALNPMQGLQWPVLGDLGLNARVKRATMMLALDALAGSLVPKVDRGIKSTKKALEGVGSTEVVYDAVVEASDPYPAVTLVLSPVASLRGEGPEFVTGMATR